jgi:hypothetical protein
LRTRPAPVGVASQHRVRAALREFCNFEMKQTNRLSRNPVYAVELEPKAKRWSAAESRVFLAATQADRLPYCFAS